MRYEGGSSRYFMKIKIVLKRLVWTYGYDVIGGWCQREMCSC